MLCFHQCYIKKSKLNIILNNLNSIYVGKGKVFGLSLTMIFLFQQDF